MHVTDAMLSFIFIQPAQIENTEFYEFLNFFELTNFTMPQNLKKIKFTVMVYNMKLDNFRDLQTYEQN